MFTQTSWLIQLKQILCSQRETRDINNPCVSYVQALHHPPPPHLHRRWDRLLISLTSDASLCLGVCSVLSSGLMCVYLCHMDAIVSVWWQEICSTLLEGLKGMIANRSWRKWKKEASKLGWWLRCCHRLILADPSGHCSWSLISSFLYWSVIRRWIIFHKEKKKAWRWKPNFCY